MPTLTMERIRELDAMCGQDVVDFVRQVRLATLYHEDNIAEMKRMAAKVGANPAVFSKYVWLQAYIAELASTFDDVPAPEQVAFQLENLWPDFESYYMDRAEKIRYEVPDDFRRRPRQQKLPLQILAPWEEEEDFLEDLQEDGDQMGD